MRRVVRETEIDVFGQSSSIRITCLLHMKYMGEVDSFKEVGVLFFIQDFSVSAILIEFCLVSSACVEELTSY